MDYVSRVSGNVKGTFDTQLGPKTLIVGENGSGKSARVIAIELALLGKSTVLEIADKTTAMPIELMRLKQGDGALHAEVEITTASGIRKAEWSSAGSIESAAKPKHKVASCVGDNPMPLRSLRAVLAGNQDGMRELFMSAVADAINYADIAERLNSAEAKSCFDAAARSSAMSQLAFTIEAADQNKRRASAAVRELDKSAPVGAIPTAREIAEAELALAKAIVVEHDAIKALGVVEDAARRPVQPRKGIHPAKEALITVLEAMDVRTECPICGSQDDDLPEVVHTRLVTLRPKVQPVTQAKKIDNSALDAARNAEHTAGAALHAARDTLQQLEASRDAYAAYQHSRSQLAQARADVDMWKRVELELIAARDSLLESGVRKLEAQVQKFLPASYVFRIILSQGDRRVCYYGFERNGNIDLALSGGESAIVQVALACALATPGELAVVVPADCSMSPKTLSAFMTAIVDAPVQIIITTTTMPSSTQDGWLIVRT